MSGTVLFNTVEDSIDGEIPIDGYNPTDSFTDLVPNGTITDITLVLNELIANDPGFLTIALYSDSGSGTPPTGPVPNQYITTLATFDNSAISVENSNGLLYNIPISTTDSLTYGSRYWIVLTEDSGSQAEIAFTASDTQYELEYNAYLFPNGDQETYIVSQDTSTSGPVLLSVTAEAACFLAGTKVMTKTGEIAVQNLRKGHMLALAGGGYAPVIWIGRRQVICSSHKRPSEFWPIRIKRDAFGHGKPHRDLFISQDHSIMVTSSSTEPEGFLIPIRYLVNGVTVVREAAVEVEYFHIELERHDVILAEGLPVESYLDTGNRSTFDNGGMRTVDSDAARDVWKARGCAPLVLGGSKLEDTRRRLLARALELGHKMTHDPDLHLLVDGIRIDGHAQGDSITFFVPEAARTVHVASRSVVPIEMFSDIPDGRRIGVAVKSIKANEMELLPASGDGWHSPELGWQWTNGLASLACNQLGTVVVEVAITSRYWA